MKIPKNIANLREVLKKMLNPKLLDETDTWIHIANCNRITASGRAGIRIAKKELLELLRHGQSFLLPLSSSAACRRSRRVWKNVHCCLPGPQGDYWWVFQCEIVQQVLWMYPEFVQGYRFGLRPVSPYRDANPYAEIGRNLSWDAGYLLGLDSCNVKEWCREREVWINDTP